MKKIIVLLVSLFLVGFVSAAEVCIVAQSEDWTKTDCVEVEAGSSGYDVIEASNLNVEWDDYGSMGHFLNSISGVGSSGDSFWNFVIYDDEWKMSPAVFDGDSDCWDRDFDSASGHYCAVDDDLIGLAYGVWESTPNMLEITEVKIYVDGDKSKADEDGGDIEDVTPDSEIKIEVEVENLYSDDMDIELEDVSFEVIIYEIDDDDDIEEESDEIDLDAEEDDKITLEFDIPFEVEHGDYDMDLIVTGEDENGVSYERTIEYEVQVEKEKHELVFTDVDMDVEKIKCSGTAVLDVALANIGRDEEDVVLTVKNADLDINFKEEFELEEDPFDDDSRFDKRFTLVVNEADKGIYPIVVEADYGSKSVTETISLEVIGCEEVVIEEDVDEDKSHKSQSDLTLQRDDIEEEIKEIIVTREKVQQQIEEQENESFLEEYGTILIVGLILAIIVVTFIVTAFVAMKQ